MEMLCLMGLFPAEYENTINKNSISGVQNAANKFQQGLVSGFDAIKDVDVSILNSLYIGSFPKRYRELKVPTFDFQHTDGAKDKNVGFTNLSGYKVFSRYWGVKKEIDKWVVNGTQENKVVLAYAMASPFVELLAYIKKKYPKVTCCLVVPDLPEYMNPSISENKIYQFLKSIQVERFKRILMNVDCFVILTEHMKEWFGRKIKYTVVEGIAKITTDMEITPAVEKRDKSIVYAGMLEEKYGVWDLVESFASIQDEEWKLELYGSGALLPEIQQVAERDPRIIIHGMVPNQEVVAKQRQVSLLVNPRNDKHEFTKYSFPSKIVEYMSSGTPMLGYMLLGIPDEYEPYFYHISEDTDGIKGALERAMRLSNEEREAMGKKAKQFIANEKNAKRQCGKIVEMLRDCVDEKNEGIIVRKCDT